MVILEGSKLLRAFHQPTYFTFASLVQDFPVFYSTLPSVGKCSFSLWSTWARESRSVLNQCSVIRNLIQTLTNITSHPLESNMFLNHTVIFNYIKFRIKMLFLNNNFLKNTFFTIPKCFNNMNMSIFLKYLENELNWPILKF